MIEDIKKIFEQVRNVIEITNIEYKRHNYFINLFEEYVLEKESDSNRGFTDDPARETIALRISYFKEKLAEDDFVLYLMAEDSIELFSRLVFSYKNMFASEIYIMNGERDISSYQKGRITSTIRNGHIIEFRLPYGYEIKFGGYGEDKGKKIFPNTYIAYLVDGLRVDTGYSLARYTNKSKELCSSVCGVCLFVKNKKVSEERIIDYSDVEWVDDIEYIQNTSRIKLSDLFKIDPSWITKRYNECESFSEKEKKRVKHIELMHEYNID